MSMLNKNNISLKTNYSLKMMFLSVHVSGIYTIEQDQIAKIIKNNKYTNRTFTIAFK